MTYQWGRCPGFCWVPVARVVGYDYANTLWRRSPWRVGLVWIATASVFSLVAIGVTR